MKEILSTYYIYFKDGQLIDKHLPEEIVVENNLIHFKGKYEIQVIIETNQEFTINYHIENNAMIDLIESRYLSNGKLNRKILLEENCFVNLFNENNSQNNEEIQLEDNVYIKENSQLNVGYCELSDGKIKANFTYHLTGENANVSVRMAALAKDEEVKHYKMEMIHEAKYTYSNMDNYGVSKDLGNMTIDGIGTIKKGMSKSVTHQTNKIMIFDEKSKASANPYLYIDDYDVKASHAAGVGKMDESHLYYLQSRGLTKREAMQLITYGYLKPVVDICENKMIKQRFEKALSKVGR